MQNTPDIINLVIKVLTLLFLAAESQTAAHKRYWAVTILSLAVWLTVFRLAILRAIAMYLGVFGKEAATGLVDGIRVFLMGSDGATATDIILLVGVIVTFVFVASAKSKKTDY